MNRVVLITGGGKGIGRATAQLFADDGYKVAVTYRESPPPAGVFGVRCDVADDGSVEEAFAAVEANLGPVEIAVMNAGVTRDELLLRMDEKDFSEVLNVNLTGAFRVAERASRSMLRARWGRLIFISSVVALYGEAGQANHAAAKAGLVGLARSLTRELGARNITANVVAPGFTATDMTAGLADEQRQHILRQVPAGRAASPEEVAAAARFLAGDAAGYISGAVVPVDGGAGMGH
ncbi:3-oxoacyl-[acyl-carrier-protein] reductase [Krasilnikovia cinnamomea]|uniref:3-oxoacyl-[acyl-carrier-protein] reductase n=1 Tax=Krasilnikovia cinnamomea TaxID=349313 RepID=A0A4Q7ZP90_9ACTN|nr:3-oxoacyl-ACP reductase FabG [Krasilnikovia cinnamomea]RZU52333.1 3-oxoacyl-[acyl-carrier-protein] reductase [Krasilnikovia cinnamomea]